MCICYLAEIGIVHVVFSGGLQALFASHRDAIRADEAPCIVWYDCQIRTMSTFSTLDLGTGRLTIFAS